MYKNIIMICFLALMMLGCQPTNSSDQHTQEKETPIKTEETTTTKSDKEDENTPKKETEAETNASTESSSSSNEQDTESNNAQGELTVNYIDVGQGDATLFQYESNKESYTILYDTGDWLGDEVVPFLQTKDIDFIDLIIISHPHADHIGQLEKVMQHFDVGEVWMSGNTANSDVFQNALQAVLDSDADYDEPTAGDVYDIGPLTLTILHPNELTGDLNEDSLSLHLAYNEETFLFTGDAGTNEEDLMMSRDTPIEADYIQLGHHGSNTSSGANFIDAVDPSTAIYSAGKDNKYGHPHQEVVSLIEKKGIKLYGTDNYGTITVTTDGENSKIKTEKKPSEKNQDTPTEKSTSNENKSSSTCIDLNKASEEELTQIQHIGEARAKDIVEARPFESVDDLIEINGIGEARLSDIKQEKKACIGGNHS